MKIEEERHGNVVILRPHGPVAGSDVEQFRVHLARVLGGGSTGLVVDLARVQYLDSQALEALVAAVEKCLRAHGTLRLCGADETVREVLALTGLDSFFQQFASVEAALAGTA